MFDQTASSDWLIRLHAAGIDRQPIIAIDGPAGSGKSTTARMVARKLGFTYLDTGAFYRALTLRVLEHGISPDDQESVRLQAEAAHIAIKHEPEGDRVYLDGRDVTTRIRAPHVTNAIAPISGNPLVRALMVERQREMGRRGGVVMEGRDIGTVVFPDADLKVFMSASLEERTRRRYLELAARGVVRDPAEVRHEIATRDEKDSQRAVAPLRPAADAVMLDTTGMTIEEQVEFIVQALRQKLQVL